jgi:hypothetical protein
MDEIIDGLDGTQFARWNKGNFKKYCLYMEYMIPIDDNIIIEDYFKPLYKYVEMLWEEEMHRLLQTS